MNTQDMKDVSGIQNASLGMQGNETSGKAIMNRQHEGDVASQTYYDNADAALLEAGDVINQLIPQIYDGTRVIRLIGANEAVKFQRINDPMDPHSIDLGAGMFDVALSTGTSYTTRRVEAAQAMMDAIQVWPQLMSIAGDLVVKAQDWPGAEELSERLKKTIPPQLLDESDGGPPPVPAVQAQQAAAHAAAIIQQLQQENQQLKTDKTIDFKKLEIQSYDAETKRITALNQDRGTETPNDLDALKLLLDSSAKLDEHDIQRAQLAHSMHMDHATHQQKQDTIDNSQELALKTLSAKVSASAKPTGPTGTTS